MTTSVECLASCREHLGKLRDRLAFVVADAPEGSLDQGVPPSGLAPRQIVRHMAMANEPYLDRLGQLMVTLPPGNAGSPVRRRWIGVFLARVAGPEGNAPIPGVWVPPAVADCGDPFTDLVHQLAEFDRLAVELAAKDLSRASVRNPMLKFAKMTVDDVYLVLTAHTERHVRQIEEGLRGK